MEIASLIDNTTKLKTFDRLVVAYVGGPEVAEMLVQFHEERLSTYEIGRLHDLHHGNVSRTLTRARMRLRGVGLMPRHWEAPTPQPQATDAA